MKKHTEKLLIYSSFLVGEKRYLHSVGYIDKGSKVNFLLYSGKLLLSTFLHGYQHIYVYI